MSPKMSKDFSANLNFSVTLETKRALTAVGYYQSQKGEYAGAARNFLEVGLKAFLARLTPKERAEYDEILKRCEIIVTK